MNQRRKNLKLMTSIARAQIQHLVIVVVAVVATAAAVKVAVQAVPILHQTLQMIQTHLHKINKKKTPFFK